eukprot:CAMPEP_0201480408 /NCGR_PEP_ID=MMETSP0151_2-20130828/4894_1 /ASSEMBLY_ACC=CAM_ASM_000257 /TAXON_ID=200890 /ORGANISM="Paramoeba atlantica, Strain 621/1 / CCAP 1560/9" /LENGTH=965 /DNA_ID=CAMNT_0047862249 /DNA_START=18 /DNA_END=2915 /DNA_ORIENTATION=+
MYTSGSTGTPKGAMISERAWNLRVGVTESEKPRKYRVGWLSFQPPAHLLDRLSVWRLLLLGCEIGCCFDLSLLFPDFKEVKPTLLSATPRFWSTIHNIFLSSLSRYQQEGLSQQVAEEKAMEEARASVGGKVRTGYTGAALPAPDLIDFLQKFLRSKISDAYGSTESGNITSGGKLMKKNIQYKLEDVVDLGYTQNDKPNPRGEICIKSPQNLSGYFKDPQATQKVFLEGGWYRTGDVGEVDAKTGALKIIDRIKNIIKLPQGEFVSIENIENIFKQSPLVDQIYIHAVPTWPVMGAVIVPSAQFLENLSISPSLSLSELSQALNVSAHISIIQKEIQSIGAEFQLKAWEVPAFFIIEPDPFTEKNGLLTVTTKMCRRKLSSKYHDQFQGIYEKQKGLEKKTVVKTVKIEKTNSKTGKILDSKDQVISKLEHLIQAQMEQSPTTGDKKSAVTIREMGLDSLGASRLSTLIRETFEIPVDYAHFFDVAFLLSESASLSHLAARVLSVLTGIQKKKTALQIANEIQSFEEDKKKQRKENPTISQMKEDLVTLALPPSQSQNNPGPRSSFSSPRGVLLTGATGFLGIHLLPEIAQQSSATIFCLIRSSSDKEAASRLKKIAQSSKVSLDSFFDRIVPLAGDLASPRLGLSSQTYVHLLTSVDVIFHCGAYVNHVLPYSALREANVIGTIQILQFCADSLPSSPKALHFISTVAAITRDMVKLEEGENQITSLQIPETQLGDPSSHTKTSGYGQSKWVAEKLAESAHQNKLLGALTIHRPAFISGESTTGHCNPDDTLSRLMVSMCQTGVAPQSNLLFDMSPVDFVSFGIIYCSLAQSQFLSQKNEPPKSFFHCLHSNHLIPVEMIKEGVEKVGYPVKTLPFQEWQRILLDCENAFRPLAGQFRFWAPRNGPPDGGVRQPAFCNDNFEKCLEPFVRQKKFPGAVTQPSITAAVSFLKEFNQVGKAVAKL